MHEIRSIDPHVGSTPGGSQCEPWEDDGMECPCRRSEASPLPGREWHMRHATKIIALLTSIAGLALTCTELYERLQ